ncbi:amidohydrolase 2 [Flagelloscypha sp. PMI_526]|nr:amidohydrolase 2 [Flagelloscypha sp. PMI_526]
MNRLLIDIHTHIYLPRYAAMLRTRSNAPKIMSLLKDGKTEDRLLILDDEPSGGRPVGPQYWDRTAKLDFMNQHGIDISVVSTANPWLDFLKPSEAEELASTLNEDLESYCSTSPNVADTPLKRLYGFGLLPLVPDIPVTSVVKAVQQIAQLRHLKGLIMGTRGLGNGLDDSSLDPVWEAIESAGLVVFIHPHYGVDSNAWGPHDNGHVLPLALGFPFETTVAITRLILSQTLDRFPSLKLLLAHSGGALAQLSSRLASCIDHDPVVAKRLKFDARHYLGRLYFDAVAYGSEELEFVSNTITRSSRYGGNNVPIGSSRMLFGTDHPFFPPLTAASKWKSVVENLDAINAVQGWSEQEKAGVRGANAISLFGLEA